MIRIKIYALIIFNAILFVSLNSSTENTEPFFNAIAKGNVVEVKRFIDSGVDINAKNSEGYTAAQIAGNKAKFRPKRNLYKYRQIIKALKSAGADAGA